MKDTREELIRVDERGQAHPIGAVASQRMRQRVGAYRLLPSPAHVVFMRYTGEDGRRDAEDGAVVRLGGEIVRAGAMCEIFGLVAQAGWVGELVVKDGAHARSLFFARGNIVGAQTSDQEERLGAILYRFGAIGEEEHEQLTEAASKSRHRIGNLAVEMGFASQESVFKYLRRQVEEIVHSTLMADDGTFFFLDGFDEARLTSHQAINANSLLMDGVTRLDEIRYFREKIPSAEYVPHRVSGVAEPGDEFQETFVAIDGVRSIGELGRVTGRGEFDTTRDVFALLRAGQVVVQAPPLSGGLTAVVTLANEALRLVHKTADAAGRGTGLRQGLESFASGAGVYDVLFMGAGPDGAGVLDPVRVVENVGRMPQDPETTLRQMLHEYVGFSLFSAAALLGEEEDAGLKARVGDLVARLQPAG